jgi:hypothetical protein
VVAGELIGAELIDTFLLRPTLIYAGSAFFGQTTGAVVGSLAADVGFWAIVFFAKRFALRKAKMVERREFIDIVPYTLAGTSAGVVCFLIT